MERTLGQGALTQKCVPDRVNTTKKKLEQAPPIGPYYSRMKHGWSEHHTTQPTRSTPFHHQAQTLAWKTVVDGTKAQDTKKKI
jgi:hypothetical protein